MAEEKELSKKTVMPENERPWLAPEERLLQPGQVILPQELVHLSGQGEIDRREVKVSGQDIQAGYLLEQPADVLELDLEAGEILAQNFSGCILDELNLDASDDLPGIIPAITPMPDEWSCANDGMLLLEEPSLCLEAPGFELPPVPETSLPEEAGLPFHSDVTQTWEEATLSSYSPSLTEGEPVAERQLPLDEPLASLDEVISAIDSEIQEREAPEAEAVEPETAQRLEQYIVFSLAETRYAAPITNVLEIGTLPRITPIPNVPAWLCGVTNLRGDILSLIDLRTFFGLEPGELSPSVRLIVVRTGPDDLTTGLIVDQINQKLKLAPDQIKEPAAPLAETAASYLKGVYEHEGQLLAVLDLDRLLNSPALRQFGA
jgi:purine-binding chemotaxis protein CheW